MKQIDLKAARQACYEAVCDVMNADSTLRSVWDRAGPLGYQLADMMAMEATGVIQLPEGTLDAQLDKCLVAAGEALSAEMKDYNYEEAMKNNKDAILSAAKEAFAPYEAEIHKAMEAAKTSSSQFHGKSWADHFGHGPVKHAERG